MSSNCMKHMTLFTYFFILLIHFLLVGIFYFLLGGSPEMVLACLKPSSSITACSLFLLMSGLHCQIYIVIMDVRGVCIIFFLLCFASILSNFSLGRHADAIFTNSYRKVLGQISARKFLQTIMGKRLG